MVCLVALSLSGCKTTMVTVESEEYTGGSRICYNDYYLVPSQVANDPERVEEHIERWDRKPYERGIKPC